MDEDYKKLIEEVRKANPKSIAEEICSVQPIDIDVKALWNGGLSTMTPEQLRAAGYRPVSNLGLMWIKDDDSSGS